MALHLIGNLASEISKISGGFIDGKVDPRAPLMVMDKNSSLMSQVQEIKVETDEETGQQTVWLMTEEY